MKSETEEKLSALIDSELTDRDLSQTLDQLRASSELRGAWDRYHLIGDTLRGEGFRASGEGVAKRVRERLEAEPVMLVRPTPITQPKSRERLPRPLVGAALAASVAAVAVFTLPRWVGEAPVAGSGSSRVATQAPAPVDYSGRGGTRWKNLAEPGLESKLNRYLENHSEHASSGGMGVLPYSSFVSYDAANSRP